jgi:hypothetical protein
MRTTNIVLGNAELRVTVDDHGACSMALSRDGATIETTKRGGHDVLERLEEMVEFMAATMGRFPDALSSLPEQTGETDDDP